MNFQATGQLLIAVIVAYVAWQNYKINQAAHRIEKDKLRLNLFDRRLRVFEACQDLLSFVVREGKPTRDENLKFLRNSSEAEFLFGKEIETYIDEMSKKSLDLIHVREKLDNKVYKTEEERTKLTGEDEELFEWFRHQYENSRKLFRKYLHFTIEKNA